MSAVKSWVLLWLHAVNFWSVRKRRVLPQRNPSVLNTFTCALPLCDCLHPGKIPVSNPAKGLLTKPHCNFLKPQVNRRLPLMPCPSKTSCSYTLSGLLWTRSWTWSDYGHGFKVQSDKSLLLCVCVSLHEPDEKHALYCFPGLGLWFLHGCYVPLSVSRMFWNLVKEFPWNLMDVSALRQGTIDLVLVVVQLWD